MSAEILKIILLLVSCSSLATAGLCNHRRVMRVALIIYSITTPALLASIWGLAYLANMILFISASTAIAVPITKKCMNAWERHKTMERIRGGEPQLDKYGNVVITWVGSDELLCAPRVGTIS